MIRLLLALILLPFSWGSLRAVPPLLNYAGQVSVNGQRFDGEAKLKEERILNGEESRK